MHEYCDCKDCLETYEKSMVRPRVDPFEIPEDLKKQLEVLNSKDIPEKNDWVKYDSGKLRWSLLPLKSIRELVKVLQHGATKYGAQNWRKGVKSTEGKDRYYDALMRHLVAWKLGEKNDPETGMNHLAHALCNVAFLLESELDESNEK